MSTITIVLLVLAGLAALALIGGAIDGLKTIVQAIKDFFRGLFSGTVAFIKSPFKFIKGIRTRSLARRKARAKAKYEKELMKEDAKALHQSRLQAAKQNASYNSAKKVKKAKNKFEKFED